jgi:hypothetical protein
MGQQQLHLIVLGIILVGLTVIMGLVSFQINAVQSNRDAVIMDLNHLASSNRINFIGMNPCQENHQLQM